MNKIDSLSSDCEAQDIVFKNAFILIDDAIRQRVFPAASVAITAAGKIVALKGFGRFTYDADATLVKSDTIFDMASLTKVIATTSMAMLLYERGLLDLDAALISLVPEFRSAEARRAKVTIRMLLAHSSGLPAYERLFLHVSTRAELLEAVFSMPLQNEPGTQAVYSDIGFILLGQALERVAGESLDRLCQREVFGPLGLAHTGFKPPVELRASIPPTVDDQTCRHRIIQGEVNDENASVLGGVAGHAGLFSTAHDMATFAEKIRTGKIASSPTAKLFTKRQDSPPGTSRALGWDTPSAPSQSGSYFSVNSYGHLGYTGTSLWIDADNEISITLLTNRTWQMSGQGIKQVRPAFHDAAMQALKVTR